MQWNLFSLVVSQLVSRTNVAHVKYHFFKSLKIKFNMHGISQKANIDSQANRRFDSQSMLYVCLVIINTIHLITRVWTISRYSLFSVSFFNCTATWIVFSEYIATILQLYYVLYYIAYWVLHIFNSIAILEGNHETNNSE